MGTHWQAATCDEDIDLESGEYVPVSHFWNLTLRNTTLASGIRLPLLRILIKGTNFSTNSFMQFYCFPMYLTEPLGQLDDFSARGSLPFHSFCGFDQNGSFLLIPCYRFRFYAILDSILRENFSVCLPLER